MALMLLRGNDDVILDVFVQYVVLEVPTVFHRPCEVNGFVVLLNNFRNV